MHLLIRNERPGPSTATTPQWKYIASVYLHRHHCLLYRDEDLGIQKQVMTKRATLFFSFARKEREFFFIDGVSTVFHSEERMLRTLHRVTSRRSSVSSR